MDKRAKHIAMIVLLAVAIYATGVAGYVVIERWDFIDAVYMTAITLSTVGFGEVNTVSTHGRFFTILLIFIGGGYYLYLAGIIVQFVIEGEIKAILGRRRLDKTIAKMENHYIVCGYGRIGRIICQQLKEKTTGVVVLEQNSDLAPVLEKDKMIYLIGNAADRVTLIKAGIRKASHLIAALATDADNVYLVLTARQISPKIYIMARAGTRQVKSTLLAAGANRVESPYDIGAVSMALRLLRPSVSNFLDVALSQKSKGIQIEEVKVSPVSKLANVMLKDSGIRQNYDIIIIAIKKDNGEMAFNPSFETMIEAGDTVIAMGRMESLKRFHATLNPI